MAFNNRLPRPRIKDNVNEGIRFAEVRTIFPDGTNVILPTTQAIQRAKALNLDLICISPNAKPPVAKVMDHGKFMFEEKKKKQEAKRNQHVTVVKELKFRPNTDDHDYEFKKNHAVEFLKEGNKVRAVVQFRGREIAHTNIGYDLLKRLITDLEPFGKPESAPRQDGKLAVALFAPIKQA